MQQSAKVATDVTVEQCLDPFEIGDKRFKIPGLSFHITCPHCGLKQTYVPDYFGYPVANGVEEVERECYRADGAGCGGDYRFSVRISVTVTVLTEATP